MLLRQRILQASLWLLIGNLALAAWAADWPTYQQNNRRNAHTNEQLDVKQLVVQWKWTSAALPDPAWSGPAKWDAYAGIRGLRSMRNYDPVFHPVSVQHKIWFGSTADEGVYCLDAATGKKVWMFPTGGPVRVAPTWADGRLYFASDDGFAYCLNANSGALIWKFKPSPESDQIVNNGRLIPFWPCRSGVLVDKKVAYFTASMLPWKTSYLCAVDALRGTPEAEGCFVREINEQTMEGPLVASPTRLIVPQGRVAPQLFSRTDGKPLGALKGGGGSFVVLANEDLILHGPGNKKGWITASKSTTGETIATYRRGNAMVVANAVSYMLTDDTLAATDVARRKPLWQTPCDCGLALVLAGDTLFAGGTDRVCAFRVSDGQQVWEHEVSGRAYGLAVANGQLLVSTDLGVLYAFARGEPRAVTASTTPEETASVEITQKLSPIPQIDDAGLAGRWVFHRSQRSAGAIRNLAGKRAATLTGKPRFARVEDHEALVLDGSSTQVLIAKDHRTARLPNREITAEAWVRIDTPLQWGGIVGAIQDNGTFERGWLLGYSELNPTFALASKKGSGKLTYLKAKTALRQGKWYHVVGTYDGQQMRLYINGKLENQSSAEQGDIFYPPQAFFEIGAYHDKDENFRMTGMLNEVRIYRRVLTATEIQQHAETKTLRTPPPADLALGPYLQFTEPGKAVIRWHTHQPTSTHLSYQLDSSESTQRIHLEGSRLEHEVVLTGLRHNRVYSYSIHLDDPANPSGTAGPYECDTFFNYEARRVRVPVPGSSATASAVNQAAVTPQPVVDLVQGILQNTPAKRGICLVLGADVELCQSLARQSQFRIVVAEQEPTRLAKLVPIASAAAGRIVLRQVTSFERLPFTSAFANLVICSQMTKSGTPVPISPQECQRLARPDGGVVWWPASDKRGQQFFPRSSSLAISGHNLLRAQRDALPGAGEWSHLYGKPNNSAFGGETLGGAANVGELEVQWVGKPGARYQPDRNGRKPAPLSTAGRLFLQGLQRLIALDAYNGTVLWSLEIPPLGRFNMPRDCSNWCADRDHLFVAIQNRCWQINAATGEIRRFHEVLKDSRYAWDADWGYVARVDNLLIGSSVKKGSSFTSFWGGAGQGWYDSVSGEVTHQVCSDQIFAIDLPGKQPAWNYQSGVILNPTITIGDGHIFFVECRQPDIQQEAVRRIGRSELWQDQFLVALDAATGKKVWEKPLTSAPGTVVFYLAQSDNQLVLVSSTDKHYHTYVYQTKDGTPIWKKRFAWQSDNHGGHMSRPAIVDNTLYVRPRVFELGTGLELSRKLPAGGCGTYACTTDALFFRSSQVTVWDRERGNTTQWKRLRPDCWLSTIPAGGMLLSPEAGGGCSCGSWMETSIGFRPRLRN